MPFVLEELEVYFLSERMADKIWGIAIEWEPFIKYGLGKRLTSAADSVSANIAEGYGRYFIKENINFCFYARGSLLETKSWIRKAWRRELIGQEKYHVLKEEMNTIHKKLNNYIKILKQNINKQ